MLLALFTRLVGSTVAAAITTTTGFVTGLQYVFRSPWPWWIPPDGVDSSSSSSSSNSRLTLRKAEVAMLNSTLHRDAPRRSSQHLFKCHSTSNRNEEPSGNTKRIENWSINRRSKRKKETVRKFLPSLLLLRATKLKKKENEIGANWSQKRFLLHKYRYRFFQNALKKILSISLFVNN